MFTWHIFYIWLTAYIHLHWVYGFPQNYFTLTMFSPILFYFGYIFMLLCVKFTLKQFIYHLYKYVNEALALEVGGSRRGLVNLS